MGFAREVSRPEMKSTAANDDSRVQQTRPRYFKRVATFRDKHYPNRSVRDALRMLNSYHRRYVFYRNGSAHVISFK